MTDLSVFAAGAVGLWAAHQAADYLFQTDKQADRKAGWHPTRPDGGPGAYSGAFFARGGAPLVDQAMHHAFGLFPAALMLAAL